MITNLNFILKLPNQKIEINFNKRYLKFLLLLCALGNLNFENNSEKILLKLNVINEKLSAFNSVKPNVLNTTFGNISNEKIEEYRKLSLLVKGSKKLIDVKLRIKFLEKEINL